MEVKTPEVLELICKSQNSIKNIRSTISQKKEIKELTDKIKKILDVMDKNIKDELENLYGYEKRLEIIKDEELNENVGIIKMIIKNNLPKEVEINSDISDKGFIKVIIKNSEKTKYNVNKFDINYNVLRVYKVILYIHDNLSYDE